MIEYNDRLIPDVGKCFLVNGQYKLTCKLGEECDEVEIGDEIEEIFPNQYIVGGKFLVTLSASTKKNIISKMFSNDDQIAIMLNYQQEEKSEKHIQVYNLMQDWRNYISKIINDIKTNSEDD